MLDFVFENHTKTIFGRNAIESVGKETAAYSKKVLLHYGGGSIKRNGVFDAVTSSLKAAGVEWVELGGVQPNPVLSLARMGIKICRKEDIGFILAIGGGSVIDSAKTIALGVHYDGDVWDYYTGRPYDESLPIGVVLTIPAAGSESSCDAVLTNEDGMLKRASCSSPMMRPVFAIMNPEVTYSLPDWQTFSGVSDIMAHIMERYFTTTPDVEVSDRLCEGLLKAVMTAARAVQMNPNDYAARAEIMWAGSLAHNNICGVDRGQEWVCHMLGHEVSAEYGATHGATLAMIFPHWLEYVYRSHLDRAVQFADRVFGVEYDMGHAEAVALEGIRRLRAFFSSIGMPAKFTDLGIDNPDIELLADKALDFGKKKLGTYYPLTRDDVVNIYKMCL